MAEKPIVFFDGVCGLCNTMVDFFVKKDKNRRLLFSPMQGETAKGILTKTEVEDLDSFVLFENGVKYYRSDAALKIFYYLGSAWRLLYYLKLFPKSLRDAVYKFIARNRYKWFDKKDSCRMPTKEERGVLLS